jgi:tripartite ATP-independent transporter DctP family solute receptor
MRKCSRRTVVQAAVTVVLAGLVSTVAVQVFAQSPIKLRFATGMSGTDIRAEGFKSFGEAIKGFAVFEPHYNATLFQQGTEPVAVQRGNLEMAMISPPDFAKQIPAFSIFSAGYLVRDHDHLIKIFDSDIGAEMYKLVEEQMGMKVLTVMYAGTRQLNLRPEKQINVPADLAGVKLRMPATEGWQFLGRALGASPTPMALGEVYTGLQAGAIDGQDNPLPTVKDAKFYEVTKQIVLTSHTVGMDFLVVSKKIFDGLKPEQQKAMIDAAKSAFAAVRTKQLAAEAELGEFFKAQGLKVYTPNVVAFRTQVQKAYLESSYAKDWPKGMLERINAVK